MRYEVMMWFHLGILLTLLVITTHGDVCDTSNGGCGQICKVNKATGQPVCSCRDGFHLNHDNVGCHEENRCKTRNGGCGQICSPSGVSVVCSCRDNFNLDSNNVSCTLKNMCGSNKAGCQHKCTSINGMTAECSCNDGWKLDDDKKGCFNPNLCKTANGGCEHKCLQKGKVVTCSCKTNFVKDKKRCRIDGCKTKNGGCAERCVLNDVHQVVCSCGERKELKDDGKTCEVKNLCKENHGGCKQKCESVDGVRVVCSCLPHFKLDADRRTCYKSNLCKKANGGCQHKCLQKGKGVTCSCNENFIKRDKKRCIRDGCKGNNGGCAEICKPYPYSDLVEDADKVVCSCGVGKELVDGKACRVKNLCNESKGGCQDTCIKSIGGVRVVCACRPGFKLNTDRKTCYDAQFCKKLRTPCEHKCEDLDFTHKCSCDVGYSLDPKDGKSCIDIKPFVGDMQRWLKSIDVDYCAHSSDCEHTCVNTLYGRKCACEIGFTLGKNGTLCTRTSGAGRRGGWPWEMILLIIAFLVVFIIFCIVCCCCARLAYLRKTICCKAFVSWKCCMTGFFCKCNKGEATEQTALYYHQVSINVKKLTGKEEEEGEEDNAPEKL